MRQARGSNRPSLSDLSSPARQTTSALDCTGAKLRLQIRWRSRVEASELGAAGIGDRAEAYLDRSVPPVQPMTDMPIADLVGRSKRLQAFCQAVDAENAAPHGECYQARHADLQRSVN